MSTPSSFMTALGIGTNLAPVIQHAGDTSKLNKILSDISESGNEKDLDSAMKQILLRVSPQNQKAATDIITQQRNDILAKRESKEFSNVADQLDLINPDSILTKSVSSILRSNLDKDTKLKLVKQQQESIPYRAEQQQRLLVDQRLKFHNNRIKEIDKELDSFRISNEQKEILQKERKENISARKALFDLSEMFRSDNQREPEEEISEVEKVTFNPQNPEHLSIFKEFDKKYKGNKKKINEEMSVRFKL